MNSDDPAYFGGYIEENFLAAQQSKKLSYQDIISFARNSFEASFLPPEKKKQCLDELDAFIGDWGDA